MGVTVMFHEEDAVPEGYIAEDVYTGEGYRIECIDPSGQSVADYISVNGPGPYSGELDYIDDEICNLIIDGE